MKTNSEKVREFSSLVAKSRDGSNIPSKAIRIQKEEGLHLVKMILDEIMEFLATIGIESGSRSDTLISLIMEKVNCRPDIECPTKDDCAIFGQVDALVDIEYYMKDTAARHGINVDQIFDVVHEANMSKKNVDGLFILRSDGKVMKPVNWESPSRKIEEILVNQIKEKSFED